MDADTRILFLVMDGLGGIQHPDGRGSALMEAETPNMDRLAEKHCTGLADPVAPGITPGSPAGHLALFGYDPVENLIGRGIVSALGIGFDLTDRDVAARVNFCTVDEDGVVTDRRAGRISTEENQRLCENIRKNVELDFDGEFFFQTVSEHRALLVLRGDGLGGNLPDTDPHRNGVPPQPMEANDEASERTAELVRSVLDQVRSILSSESTANMIITRGYDRYAPLPSLKDRFQLDGLGVARYPMYLGFARLVGMDTPDTFPDSREAEVDFVKSRWDEHNFFYLHIKKTDSYGEDGNLDGKIKVIEEVDRLLPDLLDLEPDVLLIGSDHSSPAALASHSWHPVPVLLASDHCRRDRTTAFDELEAQNGSLGSGPATRLMSIALSNASRQSKFGP